MPKSTKPLLDAQRLDNLLAAEPSGSLSIRELRTIYRWGRSLKPLLKEATNAQRRDDVIFDRRRLAQQVHSRLAQIQAEHGLRRKMQAFSNLTVEVKTGTDRGIKFYYVVFRDEHHIIWKDEHHIIWKIVPTITHNLRIQSYRLLHRNKWGTKGFHTQQREWGNQKGFRKLLQTIADYRLIEEERGW